MLYKHENNIFDSFSEEYKAPFGAVEVNEKCRFKIHMPRGSDVKELSLVMFRPGYKEKYIPLNKSEERQEDDVYLCEYSPENKGLHQYYFTLMLDNTRRYIKRQGASLGSFDGGEMFQLTVFEKGMQTPEWLKGGVMYQIFPDRFYKSDAVHDFPEDRIIHENWYDMPFFRPDDNGKVLNNDYFGGDLKGIEQKLDYLKQLGVTCIYLNPIFEAHENHRYNTADYEKIDPMLGSEKDFENLCKKAKEKGINIILDGVFSHTGADSRYFNKYGRYGEKTGAYCDDKSPFFSWYNFINYPDEYESWWGISTLPNVNENNKSYTNYICGDDGIIKKWIEKGARGWRLDVADELPDEFIDNINKAVKSCGNDKILYGEVWEDASNKESYGVRRRYLVGGQLDSVMNYPFKEAILNYVSGGSPTDFKNSIMTILEHYPKPCIDVLMNFLSTHDTERAITRLGGIPVGFNDREWQSKQKLSPAQYSHGVNLLKVAMVLQFFLPGVPCIYYGDEAGQEGYKDPFNRKCYPWDRENKELIDYVIKLSKIRHSSDVFAKGELKFLKVNEDLCVFARIDNSLKKMAIITVNKGTIGTRLSVEQLIGKKELFDAITNKEIDEIFVSPFSYQVLLGDI